MIVEFDKAYLRNLYEKGAGDKKHRFQPDIIKRYKRCIDYLKHARRIEDLYPLVSLHYEMLRGDKEGISSIRVNAQYRIEFVVRNAFDPVITICSVIELSNHYK